MIKSQLVKLFGLACLLACCYQPALADTNLDSIVAIVNSTIITQTQLDQKVALEKAQLQQSQTAIPPLNDLKKQVLQQMIDTQLQMQYAKKQGISIDDNQLAAGINSVAQQNHITVAQLEDTLTRQGMNLKVYKEQIRQEMSMNQAQHQALDSTIQVSDDEVSSYLANAGDAAKNLQEYHLQAILVPLSANPSAAELSAAQQKVSDVMSRLNSGADFQETAIEYSSGQQALKGGDMGWRPAAELPPELTAQLGAAKAGTVIGPLRANVGYYIIKYIAHRSTPMQHTVEQYHVRHIFIRTDNLTNNDQAKAKLDKIRSDIIAGNDFAAEAEKFSQDYNSAGKGGDLGWIVTSNYPPAFGQQVSQLGKGGISQPFLSSDGWELIEVLGHQQTNDTKNFMQSQVKQLIYQRKYDEALQGWKQKLRGDAYIKITDPSLS